MKKDIHPKYYDEAKVYVGGEFVGTTGSTRPEMHLDVWSGTHPFYTGQQRLLDTEGQVDRFQKRLERKAGELTDRVEKERRRRSKRAVAEVVEDTPAAPVVEAEDEAAE
jgi:large subunit ribosomal protein L31